MTGSPLPSQAQALHSRASLAANLAALGLEPGDAVMVHGAMSKLGPSLDGPDTLIDAILDRLGPSGTLLVYTDWPAAYEVLLDDQGRVPEPWRDQVTPFDPLSSRAARDYGILPEFIRTRPGARRSFNPGASVAAIGGRAGWFTADHPLDYGYGEGSPFAKLVEAGGKVLMVGAPYDSMTLLHHAEHLAEIPGKRVRRVEVPFSAPEGVRWRMIEEFDTGIPVVAGLADDYFAQVVHDYLATGRGRTGRVGDAPSLLVEAADMIRFAVRWLEREVKTTGA